MNDGLYSVYILQTPFLGTRLPAKNWTYLIIPQTPQKFEITIKI